MEFRGFRANVSPLAPHFIFAGYSFGSFDSVSTCQYNTKKPRHSLKMELTVEAEEGANAYLLHPHVDVPSGKLT